jgi:hypothetical protein
MKIIKMLRLKIIQIIVLLFLLSITFLSCKKISISENSKKISNEQIKIQDWLSSQKTNINATRIKWIDALNTNLLYDKLWIENDEDVQYIIVPIKENFKFKNNRGQRITSYLVSALNANSEILYSVVLQNKPTNTQLTSELSKGAISNIFNNRPIIGDYNIRIITIFDNYLYAKTYKEGKYISTLNLGKRKTKEQYNQTNNNNVTNTNGCIDWYWVTTYSDGSQTWEFAFRTCPGGGCYDTEVASICPEGDGGSSGGGDPQPLPSDPCTDAQIGSSKATTLAQNSNFISAKTNIIAAASASNGNEHGVTFGRDANGNITTSNITTGSANSGTVPNWPGAFADLHNHNDLKPPSSGDLYTFIDKSINNSSYETRYIQLQTVLYMHLQ